VHKSLVHADEAGGTEARYRLLETVRQYGLERLAEAGELAALRDRHLGWCLSLAEEAEPQLSGPEQGPGWRGWRRSTTTCARRWLGAGAGRGPIGVLLAGALGDSGAARPPERGAWLA